MDIRLLCLYVFCG